MGSGKSTVLGILKDRGFAVFSCDDISRALWQEPSYRRELARLFPDCAAGEDIDRAKLRARVFSDRSALKTLEKFSHPRILSELLRRASACTLSFSEVPLLYEGGYETLFDGVIAVRRDQAMRTEAVIRRDGLTAEEVLSRMARQFDPARLEEKGCFLIENDGALAHLEREVDRVLRQLGL